MRHKRGGTRDCGRHSPRKAVILHLVVGELGHHNTSKVDDLELNIVAGNAILGLVYKFFSLIDDEQGGGIESVARDGKVGSSTPVWMRRSGAKTFLVTQHATEMADRLISRIYVSTYPSRQAIVSTSSWACLSTASITSVLRPRPLSKNNLKHSFTSEGKPV